MRLRETKGDAVSYGVINALVVFLLAMVLYPIIYVISCSVSSPDLVASGKILFFPRGVNLMGYRRVFQDPAIMSGYANTLFYTVAGTAINLAVTVPAGYAMARKGLPGGRVITLLFLFTMYFSGGMVPLFMLIKNLRLYNTRWALLLLGAFSMYNCIICRSFFASVPRELTEAAEIDGCNPIRAFVQVVLPVSQALLGVMTLYFAVGHWNSYFNAMMYTSDQAIQPLQLVLRKILVLEQEQTAMMQAASDEYLAEQSKLRELIKYSVIVVSSLPVMVLYPFLQRYFVKGVMIGSVKG
ncbi:MAG: carbohydrate ABC transporter permease [Clostridiales bacterium]|nr:carbohydrate ABC transporter permease [Clostridiales bacterium]